MLRHAFGNKGIFRNKAEVARLGIGTQVVDQSLLAGHQRIFNQHPKHPFELGDFGKQAFTVLMRQEQHL